MSAPGLPVVEINDEIRVKWPSDDGTNESIRARIIGIEQCDKIKKGSWFKYKLSVGENSERETRLLHLEWHRLEKKRKRSQNNGETSKIESLVVSDCLDKCDSKKKLPSHQRILAPMVGGSELAFRLLCRRYGADLAYTPMMNSDRFAVDEEYRKEEFQTGPEDRPLVAHFSGE
jgi:hypothetical protein